MDGWMDDSILVTISSTAQLVSVMLELNLAYLQSALNSLIYKAMNVYIYLRNIV